MVKQRREKIKPLSENIKTGIIIEVNMQIQRVGARAEAIIKMIEPYLCDQYSAAMLKEAVEKALREQDRLTCQAIAEAMSENALLLDDFPVKGGLFLKEQQARNIAMNTSAL